MGTPRRHGAVDWKVSWEDEPGMTKEKAIERQRKVLETTIKMLEGREGALTYVGINAAVTAVTECINKLKAVAL